MNSVPVQALVNTLLKRAFDERVTITPMKLQKLIYFIYREYLQQTGRPLISEKFECWQYGPVLSGLYTEFRSFGAQPITKFAKNANGGASFLNLDMDYDIKQSFETIWEKYKYRTGIELSEITHRPNSAWYKAFQKNQEYLKDDDIINDYT